MAKYSWKRADGTKIAWMNCGTYRRNGTQFCTPHAIPLQVIEDIVLQDWKAILQGTEHLQEQILEQLSADRRQDTSDEECKRIETELERIRRRKQAVYEDYQDGLISREELVSYRQEYLRKEELYAKQRETVRRKQQEAMTPLSPRLLEQKRFQQLNRSIIVEMVQEILIYENHRIRIRYRFSDEAKNLFLDRYSAENS